MISKKIIVFGIILALLLIGCSSQKPAGEAITAQAIAGVQKQSAPPVIGDISYKEAQKDASINAVIDSSQKIGNDLAVSLSHSSSKDEQVTVTGHVKYELDKKTAKPGEAISLKVNDWSTEYFELQVGEDKFSFGKKSESLDTDEPVLKELQRQGIDKKDVVLEKDYGKRLTKAEKDAKKAAGDNSPDSSPFSKIYKDTKSGKNILVASGLPMVDADGMPIDVGWDVQGNKFIEKNNLFKATVNGNNVELIVKNDQPDGRKKNDKLTFNAQLFLNGVEQTATGPVLLPIDPVNSNYQNNVLEWDYGIAKRRLRLIEGKVLGSWVFASNPNGDARIKYNQVGDYKLKLGQYAIDNDTELVPASAFNSATYPFAVSDSATYNPDANPETTSVDGYVGRESVDESWASIIAGAGNAGLDSATWANIFFWSTATSNQWRYLRRIILLFDTSTLPDTAIVSAATLSLYGDYKDDGLSITPNINIYTSTPAFSTSLASSDYSQLGSTAQSTAIAYSSYSATGYNDFSLNDMTQISKTGVSKYGARNANYDVAETPPSWTSGTATLEAYMAEQGAGYKPKLVVTYTTDTCTYSSGDWNIAASDNCAITAATNLGGNDLVCSGTGTLDIGTNGKISNFGAININAGCILTCRNTAGCFG